MKFQNFFNAFFILLIIFFSNNLRPEGQLGDHIRDNTMGDLGDVLKERYIRVLTTKNSFDYYIYQGNHKGFQYEMVKSFIAHL